MQELFYKTKKKQGAYIIFSLYLIIALLAVVGLALDFANLYLRKLELQKALQSAVYAALEARLSNDVVCDNGVGATPRWVEAFPLSKAANDSMVDTSCRDGVQQNLSTTIKSFLKINLGESQYNHLYSKDQLVKEDSTVLNIYKPYKMTSPTSGTEKVDATTGNLFPQDLVTISLNLKVRTLLMGSIPFELFGTKNSFGEIVVSASATGQINPANIVLVLDTSGSMACPSTASNCILDSTLTMICDGVVCDSNNIAPNAKIRDLSAGVTAFLRKFRSGKDNIKVVPFQLFSTVLAENASNMVGLIERIQDLPASGLTNTSDAIATAIEISLGNTFKLPGDTQFILFSDGPPTAARFLMPAGDMTVPGDSIKGFAQWINQKLNNTKVLPQYNLKNYEEKPDDIGSHVLHDNVVSSPWELGMFYNSSAQKNPPTTIPVVDITSYKLAVTGGAPGSPPTYFPGPLMHTPPLLSVGQVGLYDNARQLNGTTWSWSNPTDLPSIASFLPFCSYIFPEDLYPTNPNKSCHNNDKWNADYSYGDTGATPNLRCPADESNLLRFFQDARMRCIVGDNPTSNTCSSNPQDPAFIQTYFSNRIISAMGLNPTATSILSPAFMQNCFEGLDFKYYNPSRISIANNGSANLASIDTAANSLTMEGLSRRYYNTTVMFADQARRSGATIHTIGLGDSSYSGCPLTLDDPYQNAMDDFQRKDIFLSRIANAQALYVIGIESGNVVWRAPCRPMTSGTWDGEVMNSDPGIRAGYSIATKDARALTPVFLQLARKILLSLIPQPTTD